MYLVAEILFKLIDNTIFSETSRFKGKSDEPHGRTNRPISLGNSKPGNSVIISDCWVF